MDIQESLDLLREIVRGSDNIVFFGGAGVSTESNIPDFRSEHGLYRAKNKYGYEPEVILSHTFFERRPEEFFDYDLHELAYPDAKPNDAHYALAKLEEQGKLKAVVTQNIDGLHQLAGSKNVLELHGSVQRNYCLNCHAAYDMQFMLQFRDTESHIPHCLDCGGVVRPDVVLYEESLDSRILYEAEKVISEADVLIVGGTSLVVYPAAGLVHYFNGSKLVLINKSETSFDSRADLVIHDSIGKALKYAVS